jgi:hypothetical protein
MKRARRVAQSAVLFAALGFVAESARANGRYPAADLVVFDPSDPEHLLLRTTFGLLESSDGGARFSYVCEEALGLTEGEDPMLAVAEGSVRVAATFNGLLTSADGCSYQRNEELSDVVVADLALDWGDPRRLLALVATQFPDGRFESRLVESLDSGASFSNVGDALPPDVLPLSLDVSRTEPSRVYLSVRLGYEDGYSSAVLRSRDGGRSFERVVLPGTENGRLAFIGGLHPTDPDRLYVRVNASPNTVLHTSGDGAESFVEMFAGTGKLLGFAVAPDGQSVAFGGPMDGTFVASADGSMLERRSDVAPTCLAWNDEGLYACVDAATGASFGRMSHDAREFEALLRFAELEGPFACAEDTFVGAMCESAWTELSPRFTPSEAGAGGAAPSAADGGASGETVSEAGRSETKSRVHPAGGCAFRAPQRHDSLLLLWAIALIRAFTRRAQREKRVKISHSRVRTALPGSSCALSSRS